ncbi:Kelch repeat-containing protein [Spongiivirga citrea]|uniref:Galactose oxidase n=1 Tax=Spongiivirga citrea TaxID=1481457 RepID=A0A6M0CMJ9_9FLAO|nr:kelch repeat-containing protein [Spongiivirga citrea]NER17069.1 hypothetical protein [Spongiivirga citrea]
MKKAVIYISSFMLFASCSKDDNSTETLNTPPEAFDLVGITNKATDVGTSPMLTWQAATDIDGDELVYDIYLEDHSPNTFTAIGGENDPPPEPTKIIAQGISDTSYNVARLDLSARITWKVVARDNKGGVTESDTFEFRTREINMRENPIVDSAPFNSRYGHSTIFFQDKFWLIGGFAQGESHTNDIWSSTNGEEWVLETDTAPFEPRTQHNVVIFKERLWLLGGIIEGGHIADIWSSADAINWEKETDNPAYGNVSVPKVAAFKNKLYVFGGNETSSTVGETPDDIWSSEDGVNWELETDSAPYGLKAGFKVVVFNNKMFVLGGQSVDSFTYSSAIWYTTDGQNWTEDIGINNFSRRASFNVTTFDNKLWITGGFNEDGILNDLWFTRDGFNWRRQTTNANYQPRFRSSFCSNGKELYLIGGASFEDGFFNDIWMFD